jgi:hypothetical protein
MDEKEKYSSRIIFLCRFMQGSTPTSAHDRDNFHDFGDNTGVFRKKSEKTGKIFGALHRRRSRLL